MWCFVFVILCFSSLTKCKGYEPDVSVDCEEIKTNPTTSIAGVSAIGTYKFHDDERAFISCQNYVTSQIKSDSIAFIGNNNTEKQMGSNTPRTTYLYIKLTETLNNKYVDCETYGKKRRSTYRYTTRITFERSLSSVSTHFSKKPCNSFVEEFNKCYLTTRNDGKYEMNNCAFPGDVPVIKGLLKDYILAVFYYNRKNMIIAYEYNKIGEEINLQCNTQDHTWENEGLIEKTNENGNKATFKIYDPTMAFVKCRSGNYSTKIIFKHETPVNRTTQKREPDAHTRAQDPNEKAEGGFSSHSEDPANDQGDGHYALIIGGGVTVIILVLVVVFVCLMKILKKKPKTPNPDVDVNYETLPEHNQGVMPTPRQWQEALYSLPNDRIANNDYAVPHQPTLEDMYTKPIPKNKRNVTPKDNLGYESVDELFAAKIVNSRPTLNKVLPTLAKRSLTNTYGRDKFDDNYSETASESPYAEINIEEANIKPNAGYSNVFDGQRYVNSSSNKCDYAEPAYCEPSKIPK